MLDHGAMWPACVVGYSEQREAEPAMSLGIEEYCTQKGLRKAWVP